MTFGPEPFPQRLSVRHARFACAVRSAIRLHADYRVTMLTLPSVGRFGAITVVQERFRIRHETANDALVGQADVSNEGRRRAAFSPLRVTASPRNLNDPHPLPLRSL
jgi:hypothetical protein